MKADDVSAVVKALGDLSVFGLIPITSELINHLRQCARTIVGIEQLIPAVELAVLAVEAGERDPAGAIVEDCLVLNPGPLELHDLHGVMGMIDLHEKNYSQAREHLMTSVRVCMGLRGAVMARGPSPSLLLAKQFLKVGDGDIVVRYLEKCAEVWTIRSAGIRGWIGKIEQQQLVLVAERFVIHDLSTMMLKLRALASMSRLASRLSAEEWDRILASMKREATRSVEGRLDRSEN